MAGEPTTPPGSGAAPASGVSLALAASMEKPIAWAAEAWTA
jgi:hypothetical protein